jgi:hypothetical protein
MADSDAVRSRRYRAHRAGDHSQCKHFPDRGRVLAMPPAPSAAAGDRFDAAEAMRRLASRLVTAHESDSTNTAIARELRLTLLALSGEGPADDDGLMAELRAMTGEVP